MQRFPWEYICDCFGLSFHKIIRTNINVDPLVEELERVESEFEYAQNPSPYNNGGLGVISLLNNAGSITYNFEDFHEYQNTPPSLSAAGVLAPKMVELAKSFGLAVNPIRIMSLVSGGMLTWHNDVKVGKDQSFVARIHVPLVTNPYVKMKIGNDLFHMDSGSAYWIDVDMPHCVVNMGDIRRSHLVFDFDYEDFMVSDYSPGYKELREKLSHECRAVANKSLSTHWVR